MSATTAAISHSTPPHIVFRSAGVLVFCDGDFWHGRGLAERLRKLKRGHNAPYWVAKITSNVERDLRTTQALWLECWTVLRFWETDILRCPERIAEEILRVVKGGGAVPSSKKS